ncbi:hypothetical protein AMECASPLE_003773 [Ameca splendens]|uniref:Uncharacterized protein n=1 Tax=Ameca splendens TaxID=208324 RepID=A0ABV0Z8E0_9TELE
MQLQRKVFNADIGVSQLKYRKVNLFKSLSETHFTALLQSDICQGFISVHFFIVLQCIVSQQSLTFSTRGASHKESLLKKLAVQSAVSKHFNGKFSGRKKCE